LAVDSSKRSGGTARRWQQRQSRQHQRRATAPLHFLAEALEPRRLLAVSVLNWHNDLGRTGLNSNEISLTPANVNKTQFGKLLSFPVTGQVFAQPLYVPNLTIPGKGTFNVAFVATETNDVYAFDTNINSGGGLLWHVNLGPAAAVPNNDFGNRYGPYHDINPFVGITGTPVIDLAGGTMYLDSFTHDGPNQNDYSHHIHALDITTGLDKVTPMLVATSVKGNGVGGNGTSVPFVANHELQRPGLTLLNGVLYVVYGGFADTDPYHGWVLGFNPTNLQLQSVLNTTPNKDTDANAGEGGIWMTGAAPASDGTNLFLMVGNGDFNASPTVGDWGDSVLKISLDPTSTQANPNVNGWGLKVADYFTPYNEQALADADADLGSGGGMVLPDQPGAHPHEFIGSGKEGKIYVINRDNMGHHNPASAGNDNNTLQTPTNIGNGTWSSPAYFNSRIYYQAQNDVLKEYTLTNGVLSAAPVAQGSFSYPYPGATPSISSNGNANGIVWDVQYDGSHAVLRAYDAISLQEIYDSNQSGTRDAMGPGVKFITPIIADGLVFVGTGNTLTVFGELNLPTTPPNAPSNLAATALSASRIQLTWTDNSNNEGGFKIERSTNGTTFTQVNLSSANSTSFTDTDLTPNTKYFYRIRATNIIGDSAYTNPPVSATTYPATPPIDVYHFDEGSGTTAADSAGTNNGTLQGSPPPTWVLSPTLNDKLQFSGDGTYNQAASQSIVKLTNNLAPVLGSTSTLAFWLKTTQTGNNTHYMAPAITGVDQANGTNDINWGTLDATGHIGIFVGDAGLYTTSAVNNGIWHHVAITRDATTGKVQIFLDGSLNASTTLGTGNKTSQFSSLGALTDVAADGVTPTGNNYFSGTLDEVRIYNQVLSSTEIMPLAITPGAPTLNSVTAVSATMTHLTWTTPSLFTTNIEVWRRLSTDTSFTRVAVLDGSAAVYDDTNLTPGATYDYYVRATDPAGSSAPSNDISVSMSIPTVINNFVFYNNSIYDGQNGSSNLTDRNAIATDKQPLLPGQTATAANYTTYSKGLNGVMIEVANMVNFPRIDDFNFRVGTGGDPSTWAQAPTPTFINIYPGRGTNGSTQITIIWDDNAIQNEWLQVTLQANSNTQLTAPDIFYYGNLIGDANGNGTVTVADTAMVKAASGQPVSGGVTSATDINRDGQITVSDIAAAKAYQGQSLTMITAPAAAPAPAPAAAAAAISISSATATPPPAAPRASSSATPFSTRLIPPPSEAPLWLKRKKSDVLDG
jgi:hypothetical protein